MMGILLHPGIYHLPHTASLEVWAAFICLVALYVALFYQTRGDVRKRK